MITYISSTVFDFVIFVATVGRLYHLFRLGKTRLVRVILRDTLWYFLILFSEALASLLLYVFLPASHAALAALLLNHTHALSVVIVARIILNLREVLMSGISIDTLTAPPGEYDSSGEEPGSGEPWPGSLVFAPCAPEAVSRCEQIELGEIHWPKV
ncbi:hypothetical protein PsYK624_033950 [Phanerochaete sordida]|uniref:Uncharacterized protein n=1 Tax=Phanerochaete sordida TaxID=48140 RepID=A0A9P3LAZ6_9APHY|nr:hypothetical protein PsYK624_033950 [Phanerochaete sordida]